MTPTAPGRIGEALEPAAIQTYLTGLEAWVRARRTELDELDAAALAAGRGPEVAGDMALALASWKAVSDRYQLLWATWDGGRVLLAERERIASLIHGRLDGATGATGPAGPSGEAGLSGLAVSVPEACRLNDALTAQLRTALALMPGADAAAARIKDLRAQCERLRDQVALEPATGRDVVVDRLAGVMARVAEAADRAGRGADVGGLLGPLEQDAATFERDLIVGNARRHDARGQVASARELRADLEQREAALGRLAEVCVATVDPAPRYAVPDVELLGPVPDAPEEIGAYRQRLDRVGQAMTLAQDRYAASLAEHTDLVDLLDAWVAKARALGVADHPDLVASAQTARAVLARRPAPVAVARQLVSTYQAWLTQVSRPAPSTPSPHTPGPRDPVPEEVRR